MRRYHFLSKDSVYQALNKLRAAFLAAKDGSQVDEIIKTVLTHDERMKIGRRIQIAQMLKNGFTYAQIKEKLKVGPPTIRQVDQRMQQNPLGYQLIEAREEKVEKVYKSKAYEKIGGPKLIFKKRKYTGLKRKGVKR